MQSIELGSAVDALSRVLAVLISIVGLIIAVEQVTLGARLRRRQTWLREELSHENDAHRRVLLTSLLDRASASLVAGVLMPNKYLFEAVLWLALAPAMVVLLVARATTVTNVVSTIFLALIALALPVRRGIRVFSERRRIVFAYRAGGHPIAAPKVSMLAQMEGGTKLEFLHAFLLSLSVISLAAGIALFVLGIPFLISFGFAAIGTGGAWVVLLWVDRYAETRAKASYESTTQVADDSAQVV